ncbi:MAG: hypothetical protein A2147_04480 [Chloroflexi bacterium RBG_16_57_8]|nr:MAG: hypothetical protein A2147_04480 [Chloroflexi bacterium RBG_16_57_8]
MRGPLEAGTVVRTIGVGADVGWLRGVAVTGGNVVASGLYVGAVCGTVVAGSGVVDGGVPQEASSEMKAMTRTRTDRASFGTISVTLCPNK